MSVRRLLLLPAAFVAQEPSTHRSAVREYEPDCTALVCMPCVL